MPRKMSKFSSKNIKKIKNNIFCKFLIWKQYNHKSLIASHKFKKVFVTIVFSNLNDKNLIILEKFSNKVILWDNAVEYESPNPH